MQRRRVLIFSLAYYPKHIGGAEVAIKEITDRISPEDIEFHMVCLRFDDSLPKAERVGNVLVHRIGPTQHEPSMADLRRWPLHYNKHLYQVLAVWKAHRLHTQYRYDGMWAMMAHSCGVPAALFKLMHPKVAYVQTLQEGDPPEYIERLMRPLWPLFRRAFTTPTVIQTISTFLAQWASRMGAVCPIEVVPNGVDVVRFTAPLPEEGRAAMRAKIGARADEVWLVTTSRLVHKNAVDDVIRALPSMQSNVHFAIFGTGPDETMLRSLAHKLGVAARVHFMGQAGHDTLPLYLKACDIFIRPSRSEGMGNSFIEAMAARVPVIATREGGIADFLFDPAHTPDKQQTGWVVDADAPEQIASAIGHVLAEPERTRQVIEHAYELACSHYDWNRIAEAMRSRVFSHIDSTY